MMVIPSPQPIRRPYAETDFADGRQVAALAHMLTAEYSAASADGSPSALARISKEAAIWLAECERTLPTTAPRHLTDIAAYFDIIHRIVRHRPAPEQAIANAHERVIEAYLAGDKSILETDVMRIIGDAMARDIRHVQPAKLSWYVRTQERWLRESRQDATFPDISRAEALLRAAILLRANLFALTSSQQEYKAELAATHAPALLHTAGLDSGTLRALLAFARAAWPAHLSTETLDAAEARILSALSTADDLLPLDRAAYVLDRALRS